nr:pre-mRNA-splicing factor ATP-dependent RNA helicase DEAH10-like isoform X2 [Ipomoea trifida]
MFVYVQRFALAGAELNGAFYAVGGYDGSIYLKKLQSFVLSKLVLGFLKPFDPYFHLYALGGYDGSAMVASTDPRLGKWMAGEQMKHCRGYLAPAAINDTIFFVIGGVKSGEDIADTIEVYKDGQGWQKKSSGAVGRSIVIIMNIALSPSPVLLYNRIALVKSMETLFLLGAITENNELSNPTGHQMARLPLEPMHSKALILAGEFGCLEEMLISVAMLSVESIFYAPREKLEESRNALKSFASLEGDHLTLLNVYRASNEFFEKSKITNGELKAEKNLRKWCKDNFINSRSLRHARDVHSQIRRNVEQMGLRISSCGDDMLIFRRCLAASFFLNAALKQPDGTYRVLSSGSTVQIHPSSVLFRAKPECIVFNELVQTNYTSLLGAFALQSLWSLCLAIADVVYRLSLKSRFIALILWIADLMDAKQEKREDEKSREMWMHVVAIDECSSRRSDRSAVEDGWIRARAVVFRLLGLIGVFFRLSQLAFATYSVFLILLTSGIPSHGYFRSLLGAFALQSLWSLCLVIADVVYRLSLKSSFIVIILWFGDVAPHPAALLNNAVLTAAVYEPFHLHLLNIPAPRDIRNRHQVEIRVPRNRKLRATLSLARNLAVKRGLRQIEMNVRWAAPRVARGARIRGGNHHGFLAVFLAKPGGVYAFYFEAGAAAFCFIVQCGAQSCGVWGIDLFVFFEPTRAAYGALRGTVIGGVSLLPRMGEYCAGKHNQHNQQPQSHFCCHGDNVFEIINKESNGESGL